MKRLTITLLLGFLALHAIANHITGGEMYYTYVKQDGNNYIYHVTLNLYRDCHSTGAQLDEEASIAVFDNVTNAQVSVNSVPRSKVVVLNLTNPSPCILNPPEVCYQVGYYEFDVTLPASNHGYTIAFQRCCRITGINNVINSSGVGATYTAEIPGTSQLMSAPINNSAHFNGNDLVVTCALNPFRYDFSAEDKDGDSLHYYFCNAFSGGLPRAPKPEPPSAPPYQSVPYASPYNGTRPLGSTISINPKTGLITGKAPVDGIYVVTVCVDEYRKGIKIATQHKDLQIKVADCSLTTPQLDPDLINCNGYDLTFVNNNNNSLVHSYYWDFGDGSTSTIASPVHHYSDTGTYAIKLVVNKGQDCADSTATQAKVYPGFFPGFSISSLCLNTVSQFTDLTKTNYGYVNSWQWDFGDPGNPGASSTVQNPQYKYSLPGTVHIEFTVTSSKGCIATIDSNVVVYDKPPLSLSTNDTLICKGDHLPLQATGNGNFTWTPASNISSTNTASTVVNPPVTTNYVVSLNDKGCINTDTVQVRVADFITLAVMNDTTICKGDSLHLMIQTNGLHYQWTPASDLNDPAAMNPEALPKGNTTYQVTSYLGGCVPATGKINVRTIPYPGSQAGADTLICYNASAQLHGVIKGSSFYWLPAGSLNNPLILDPVASPLSSTAYVLTVYDTLGCPKPGLDTVVVNVMPKIQPYAGNDTAVVVGQPLQFNASGGINYVWTPSTSLTNDHISNPVGVYNGSFDSIRYKVLVYDQIGCVDSTSLLVKIFRTAPWIFVPSAFTPNGDGKNDVFRPIPVGISKLEYFRVYNRWGELVFSTTTYEEGWDGKLHGKDQATGTFVWMVQGTDYTGRKVTAKGTVTLIR